MAERDSNHPQLSAELIAAQTQEIVNTVRENQRELDARIAETSDLIDRTQRLLQDSETLERETNCRRVACRFPC